MKTQRVLIIESERLLGASIEHLLAGESQLQVIGITVLDGATLIQAIRRLQPDVLILDRESLVITPNKLLAELSEQPQLRLMLVNPNDDRVQVYDKREVLITRVADLVNLIRGS